ncbi:Anaphase-promoting complex subunit 15 [Frankliniella fusca]|uniref:Anaphase-promoting complex subunit 15 n=1 Tax=Frankliniella fusca TaxID=407009 RepID=A0AAE1HQ16_9NEOP|nr:Anaphase-promoting complex subunit 15 [Frankliniella fusca]
MSIPLFPSLRPNLVGPFWCELDPPIDEEAEILQLEREQREWKDGVSQMFANVSPIGKMNQDADDDDLDDMGDDEDDTTSSDDGDDMDDDNDVPGMFRIHDNLSPSPDVAAAVGGLVPTSQAASTFSARTTGEDSNESSSSSESSVTVTLNRVGGENADLSAGNSAPTTHPVPRPARMIVGTHVPAARPGMPQQPVRLAFISTTDQTEGRQQSSLGSVSPTSRAYIDAALQSPTGQFHLDIPDDDDDTDDDIPDRAAPSQSQRTGRSQSARTFPGPVSDQLRRYQQMMAAGSIRPSLSSTQIDSLIESMHQRAHAARAAALTPPSTSTSEVVTQSTEESDTDGSLIPHQGGV